MSSIDNVEFWQKVKGEYNPSYGNPFICETSETFRIDFESHRDKYINMANEFLEGYKRHEFWQSGADSLFFHVHKEFTHSEYIFIRKKFIAWMINKFKNAKLQDNTGTNGDISPPPNFPENNADTGN